jgi:NTP pyrophosphatase (non-canonical NTP hydrolase)
MKRDLAGLTRMINVWAIERGLDEADPVKQMLKLTEEVGELAAAMARGDREKIIDSIGDVHVVLTILTLQMKLSMTECVQHSYDEIKDRRGRLVNGVFVKEADL